MEIEYTSYRYNKEYTETKSVENFVSNQILNQGYDKNKIRLEYQAEKVANALGRFVEKLMEKGLLNLEDLHDIADSDYGMRNKAKIKEKTDES